MKRCLSLIVSFAVALSLAGCSSAPDSVSVDEYNAVVAERDDYKEKYEALLEQTSFDINLYRETVSAGVEPLFTSATAMYSLAKYEGEWASAYQKAGSKLSSGDETPDTETILNHTYRTLDDDQPGATEKIEAFHSDATSHYKEITTTEIQGQEAEELRNLYTDMYDNYLNLYNCAMSPGGDPAGFLSSVNTYYQAICNANDKLTLLLASE